jgi:hypothetical protein
MPYRRISRNVKLAAIRLHEHALLPLEDVLDCLRISRRTFYRISVVMANHWRRCEAQLWRLRTGA